MIDNPDQNTETSLKFGDRFRSEVFWGEFAKITLFSDSLFFLDNKLLTEKLETSSSNKRIKQNQESLVLNTNLVFEPQGQHH